MLLGKIEKMKAKFSDLLAVVVKSLSEKLLEQQYPLGKKNFFNADPLIDHQILDIFLDHLASRSKHAETFSELLGSKEKKVFDELVKDRVYDVLYMAHGGLR